MYNEADFVSVRDPLDAVLKLRDGDENLEITCTFLDGDRRYLTNRLLCINPPAGRANPTLIFEPKVRDDFYLTTKVDLPNGPKGFLSFFSATRAVGRTESGLRYVLSTSARVDVSEEDLLPDRSNGKAPRRKR